MDALTEKQIRASFVNASRREAAEAVLPDLDALEWERLDYLGWADAKRPRFSYVVLPVGGEPRGVLLRADTPPPVRRKAMCGWCEDIVATDHVRMFYARRAGKAGRLGNTVGTLICADFGCSRNVRRAPSVSELGGSASPEEREFFQSLRIEKLREKAEAFLDAVLRED